MNTVKQTPKKDGLKRVAPRRPKVTATQYDEAFDSLAAFLFERYRKSKEEV
jgi:hypothetical protein